MKPKRSSAPHGALLGAPRSRRRLIAETALNVLAAQGARGLTHRAVDEAAALPTGSTSFYFRTREELIAAAATTLCEHDARDVQAASQKGGVPSLLARWSSPTHRRRLVARFELFLDATRNPTTRKLLRVQRRGFVRAAEQAFTVAGVADPTHRAALLVATIDGLLLGQMVDPSRAFDALRRAVAAELRPSRSGRARNVGNGRGA